MYQDFCTNTMYSLFFGDATDMNIVDMGCKDIDISHPIGSHIILMMVSLT